MIIADEFLISDICWVYILRRRDLLAKLIQSFKMRWWINLILPMCSPQLSINAFDYNCHVDLIKLLRQEGELLRLRKARQKMSELFPLTEGWCAAPTGQTQLSHYLF